MVFTKEWLANIPIVYEHHQISTLAHFLFNHARNNVFTSCICRKQGRQAHRHRHSVWESTIILFPHSLFPYSFYSPGHHGFAGIQLVADGFYFWHFRETERSYEWFAPLGGLPYLVSSCNRLI